ncbi:MAG: bifunctional glutamine synthetase adenylyltransferase/deadenyltransferase, partial [Nitrosomonas sp.]
HWLTTHTSAGVLYETDLRLRPSGVTGALANSMEAFANYQHELAWVWEHQALTRARFVVGDQLVGEKFEQLRRKILCQPRELTQLKQDITMMRRKMLDAHPNTTNLFDIKHDRGGIIDVEFIVQFLVLGYAHQHPQLTGNIGNIALLKLAGELGLIPIDMANTVLTTYREFRRLQHQLRLNGAPQSAGGAPAKSISQEYARVPANNLADARQAVLDLCAEVFGT